MNDDIVIDQIPLAEIHRVKGMEAGDKETELAKDENELMIETHPEGYNSGRTYYLQAQSKASCQEIIKKLVQHSAAAFERAHAQSVFRQAQIRVLKVYRSIVFQRSVAVLIILVSIFKWASHPEKTADVPFDRTLSSACWMLSTSNKAPSDSTILFFTSISSSLVFSPSSSASTCSPTGCTSSSETVGTGLISSSSSCRCWTSDHSTIRSG